MGIEPNKPLDFLETSQIVTRFIQSAINAFPFLHMDGCALAEKMYKCKMYWADFGHALGNANYMYQNQSIYIRQGSNLMERNDVCVWHECIHSIQDTRDDKGHLYQMGLCEFSKYKAYGVGMNEAATQYVTAKMLQHPHELIQYCGITCRTISKMYYPIMCNLIEQIENVVGEELLITSTLYGKETCITHLMEVMGETIVRDIQDGFDKMLEQKPLLAEGNIQAQEIVRQAYIHIQKTLLEHYFEGSIGLAKTIEELQKIQQKLEKHMTIMGNVEQDSFYDTCNKQLRKKIEKKMAILSKHSNLPAVIQQHTLSRILKAIYRFFVRKKEEY